MKTVTLMAVLVLCIALLAFAAALGVIFISEDRYAAGICLLSADALLTFLFLRKLLRIKESES